MPIQRYKISNLLYYQVRNLEGMLDEGVLTVINNFDKPHFFDAFAGLNDSEVDILSNLGFCLTKHVALSISPEQTVSI